MITVIVRNFVLLAAVLIAMAVMAALFLAALLGMVRLVRGAHPWPARPGGPKAPPTHPPFLLRLLERLAPGTGNHRLAPPPPVHEAATQPIPRVPTPRLPQEDAA